MTKLSKEKRDKLMLTCIGAGGIVAVLYFLIITDQKAEIAELQSKIVALRSKRDTSDKQTKRSGQAQADLDAARKLLTEKQTDMPREGEDHVWFFRIMDDYRRKYDLDVVEIKNPYSIDPGVLPKFQFKAVALDVIMAGSYADFGRFLADFENTYPYMRVQIVSVTPEFRTTGPATRAGESAGAQGDATDKLRFNYKVIALIKSPV